MRYGIKTVPAHTTGQEVLDVWRVADDIPVFESAWNWDHFYPLTGDLTGDNLEAWTMLAALAQATRRIRLGVQVTGIPIEVIDQNLARVHRDGATVFNRAAHASTKT